MYCTSCGTKLDNNINYCGNCGNKIEHIDSKQNIVNEKISLLDILNSERTSTVGDKAISDRQNYVDEDQVIMNLGTESSVSFFGFHVVTKNKTKIKYPLSSGYKISYIIGTILYLTIALSGLDTHGGGFIADAVADIIMFILITCIIGLAYEFAVRKDFRKRFSNIKLPSYLSYKKNKNGEEVMIETTQEEVVSTYILEIILTIFITILLL